MDRRPPLLIVLPVAAAIVIALVAIGGWVLAPAPRPAWPLFVALGALVGLVILAEYRIRAWRDLKTADNLAAAPASAPQPGHVDLDDVEPLGQDDYAQLLAGDATRWARYPRIAGPRRFECATHGAKAVSVRIGHPIWDGPMHGGGSGKVDTRDTRVCPQCDPPSEQLGRELGLWPAQNMADVVDDALTSGQASGRPIRLPWLGSHGIRLRDELYERPVFHNLIIPVERQGPPAPPAPSKLPHPYTRYEGAELKTTPPPELLTLACEVCAKPYDDPIHGVPAPAALETGNAGTQR